MEIMTVLLWGTLVMLLIIALRGLFARKRTQTCLNAAQEQLSIFESSRGII